MLQNIIRLNSTLKEEMAKSVTNRIMDILYEDVPENATYLLKYQPELFKDSTEEEYIETLCTALQTSLANRLYQFAYIQEHMIFMTAIYFVCVKISIIKEEEFKNALYYILKDRYSDFFSSSNTKEGQLYFGSFARINESDVFLLLKIIGMDSNLEGELKKLVEERNKYAHANGNILITSRKLIEEKIEKYNNTIERVFCLLKPLILKLYETTLVNSNFYDEDIRAYSDANIQIQEEFVRIYSLSRIELNWCRKFNIKQFANHSNYSQIKELHIELCNYYKTLDEYSDEEE